MGGWKMVAARRAAARVLDSLTARDRFAVLAFDTVVERPPGQAALAPASDRARWAAVEWLARLEARGGTEMLEPLRAAAALLAGPESAGTSPGEEARDRFLILVTDGQVGAEDQILAAVTPVTGSTRIFTLGIDQAVNAGFLRRLAAAGAGRCELVESEDRLDEVMTSLHRRISPPLVTGLRVESASAGYELVVGQAAPGRSPDLFPGTPCTLSGRWRAEASPTSVTLTVLGAGGFREQVTVAAARPGHAVRTCWARARVRDLEDRFAAGPGDPALADQIVAVSLRHAVLSRFTAFVAVDRTRRVDVSSLPSPVTQPVELPGGWVAQLAAPAAAIPAFAAPAASPVPPAPAAPQASRLLSGKAASLGRQQPAAAVGAESLADREHVVREAAGHSLAAYAVRADELFARIEALLAGDADRDEIAAAADQLTEDLLSVGSPEPLTTALRRLAEALRRPGDPQAELAAARRAFADVTAPSALGAEPPARRNWWRITPGNAGSHGAWPGMGRDR
jgi:Ca-activated chloride channel homolog